MTFPRKTVLPALLSALLLSGCGDRKPGMTLRVGVDAEFPPFCSRSGDELVGFDVDLAREVCRRLGWKYEPVPVIWEEKELAMAHEKIDCIWTAFTYTGRESLYAWCDCYCEDEIVVLVRADSDIAETSQLAGRVVAVQTDTTADDIVSPGGAHEKLGASFKKRLRVTDCKEAVNMLRNRTCDALIVDKALAAAEIGRSNTALAVLPEALVHEQYSIAFPFGREDRRDAVNRALREMVADGTAAAISKKHFNGADVIALKPITSE